jgi:hypothetical protein
MCLFLCEVGETFELDRVDTGAATTEAGESYTKVDPEGLWRRSS